MLSAATLPRFPVLALGLAVTPGPNRLSRVSRSVAQGPWAGLVSLAGCQAGSAGGIARFFTRRPRRAAPQRWTMGGALGGLAVGLAQQGKR